LTRRSLFQIGLAGALAVSHLHAAERAQEVMATIEYVAVSLSEGNGTDAVTPFDKSTAGYNKLASYFQALTDEARVQSDVELIEESGSDTESKVTLRWTLAICMQTSGEVLERRVKEVRVRLVPAKTKKLRWKIVSLDPIEFFNPIVGKW
jgi:hypothetical protein